jgi:hypothetical protein
MKQSICSDNQSVQTGQDPGYFLQPVKSRFTVHFAADLDDGLPWTLIVNA